MLFQSSILRVLLFTCSTLAQGPNTLYAYNPNLRTQATNGTWFIVPINKTSVQSAVTYPLLPLPTTDKTIFPFGFPANTHPVVVSSAYGSDIRMGALTVDVILNGALYVPYVDILKDGKTAFQYPLKNIISAFNNEVLSSVIPTLGAGIDGQPASIGHFTPGTAAWQSPGSDQNSVGGKISIVENPLNPSVDLSLYDIQFSSTTSPLFTEHTFKSIINQPILQSTGQCLRNTIYFNATDAEPKLRTGRVQLYDNYAVLPEGFAGVWTDLGGFTGAAEAVGYNPENCKTAAANVDPVSTA